MATSTNDLRLNQAGPGRKPVIAGASMIPFRRYRDGSNFRDWIRKVCCEAISEANLKHADIDAVIVANESDLLSLQVSPAALIADEIGLQYASAVHVEAGGASGAAALHQGFALIASGLAEHVLVTGFEQTASRLDRSSVQKVFSLSFDADLEGWAEVSTASLYALSYQAYCDEYDCDPALSALVSVKNHRNAMHNQYAHNPMQIDVADVLASKMVSEPFRLLDCSIISDGAAAIVLSSPNTKHHQRPHIQVSGSACSTDYVRLGDRPHLHRFQAKERAAETAYGMAGIATPSDEIDAAEVYDAFSGSELQSIEALGLSEPGEAGKDLEAGRYDADGPLPVNISGGLIGQGGAPGATGLAQAITLYRLLSGNYFDRLQLDRTFRRGIVDTHSGIATTNVIHVLERVDDEQATDND